MLQDSFNCKYFHLVAIYFSCYNYWRFTLSLDIPILLSISFIHSSIYSLPIFCFSIYSEYDSCLYYILLFILLSIHSFNLFHSHFISNSAIKSTGRSEVDNSVTQSMCYSTHLRLVIHLLI